MNTGDPVEVKIGLQGGVLVNTHNAYIGGIGPDVVAICVDLKTKRADIGATHGGEIYLDVGEETLHYDAEKKDNPTMVCFPQFAGWSLWCADVSRYTLSVCLIKKKNS